MHHCPHCPQEFSTFAFYCPRCHKPIGGLAVEGDMMAIWWLDAQEVPKEKWGLKALRSGLDYVNLLSVSTRPSAAEGQSTIKFTVRSIGGEEKSKEKSFELSAVQVFAEVSRPEIQEWQIQ